MGCSKSSSKSKVYRVYYFLSLPQEIRKTSKKYPNLIPKGTREITKTKVNRRKKQS